MMHQPVDQGRGQCVVHIEEGSPFPEGAIRGDHDRTGFVPGGDYLEQQVGPALVDGQIAQLIEEKGLLLRPGRDPVAWGKVGQVVPCSCSSVPLQKRS